MMLFVGAPLQKTAMICVSDLKAGLSNRVVGNNNPVNRVDHTGLNPSYAGIKGVHTQMALPSNIFIGGNVSDRRAIEAGIVESLSGPYGQALFDGVVDSGLPILFLRADSAELNETAGKIMSRQNRQGNTLGGKKRFRRDCQGNYHFDDDKIVILLHFGEIEDYPNGSIKRTISHEMGHARQMLTHPNDYIWGKHLDSKGYRRGRKSTIEAHTIFNWEIPNTFQGQKQGRALPLRR